MGCGVGPSPPPPVAVVGDGDEVGVPVEDVVGDDVGLDVGDVLGDGDDAGDEGGEEVGGICVAALFVALLVPCGEGDWPVVLPRDSCPRPSGPLIPLPE